MLACSCSQEDDLTEIFVGKTWYMLGGELNGSALNGANVSQFYNSGSSAYTIAFQTTTFTGTLSGGSTFSGTWTANGKTHSLSLNIKQSPSNLSTFDHDVFAVIKNLKYYEGDSQVLNLHEDKENFIRLNYTR